MATIKAKAELGEIAGPSGSGVARLMGLIALVALAFAWPPAWLAVVPVLADRLGGVALGREWARALALTLGAVYLPCVVGFFSDCDHCRRLWAAFWPAVPGVVPGELIRRLLGVDRTSDVAVFATGVGLTLLLVLAVAPVVRRGGVLRVAALAATALYATLSAIAVHAAVRS